MLNSVTCTRKQTLLVGVRPLKNTFGMKMRPRWIARQSSIERLYRYNSKSENIVTPFWWMVIIVWEDHGVIIWQPNKEAVTKDCTTIPRYVREQRMTCTSKLSLTAPIFGTRHLRYGDVLPTKPQRLGWVSHLPTDTVVCTLRYASSYAI